jgi:hypothetical protein
MAQSTAQKLGAGLPYLKMLELSVRSTRDARRRPLAGASNPRHPIFFVFLSESRADRHPGTRS